MNLKPIRSTTQLVIQCLFLFGIGLVGDAYAQKDVHAAILEESQRKAAPSFALEDENGKELRLAKLHGKVLLLNFWATKCGGCVLEIPSFIEIQKKYATQKFTAIGVSSDIPYQGLKDSQQAWALVKPFMVSHQMNYPIVVGDAALIDRYGFQSYPATYLIDKKGRIAALYEGIVSKEDVEKNIKLLLAEREQSRTEHSSSQQ